MGIISAVLDGNNYVVTETISGLTTSRLYNLLETTAYLTQESSGYQTCQLVTENVPNVAVSDNPGSVYFGNSIFGSTVPSVVFTSAKVNCGSSVSSGGGGGGGGATSTSGLQTTGNTSLASIDNKTPALGQALASASSPVVLTAIQVTALTPPTNTGYALDVSVNSLLKPASTLAALTTLGTITNALPVGANTIGNVNQTIGVAGFGKITDGANTSAVKAASSAAIATDPALVVVLSPNGGQATALNQATTNTSLASIDLKTPTLGQKLSVGSVPVVIASDNIVTVRTDQTTHGTTDKVAADLIQVAGVPITVGLGAATANSQRIAIANDSRIIPWDGITPITVKPASINALTTETAEVVALRPLVTTQVGQVNPLSDTPLVTGARIRSLLFTNTSGATVFLGVYSSAVALTSASVVLNGYVIRVPAGATLDKGIADFSVNGRLFGATIRIGLSSTMATFTALTAPVLALTSLNLELN